MQFFITKYRFFAVVETPINNNSLITVYNIFKYIYFLRFDRDVSMARANSKMFHVTFVLIIIMVFWVSLVTAAEGKKTLPGRNETKGKQMSVNLIIHISFSQFCHSYLLWCCMGRKDLIENVL